MWNITSNNVQRAKEQLHLRRAEIEARYAEENRALDAEASAIDTLERAASEFILRHRPEEGGSVPTDLPSGGEADGSWTSAAEASAPADMPADEEIADSLQASAAQSPAEMDPAGGGDIKAGLDFLKPGSRWRLYRNQPTDQGSVAGDAPHIG
ncbi:MAG TPA: hypothetical protein VGR45_10070 [Stellaceae bacterium]|nr:hypothetical protein [Stellaceae bacterium]